MLPGGPGGPPRRGAGRSTRGEESVGCSLSTGSVWRMPVGGGPGWGGGPSGSLAPTQAVVGLVGAQVLS